MSLLSGVEISKLDSASGELNSLKDITTDSEIWDVAWQADSILWIMTRSEPFLQKYDFTRDIFTDDAIVDIDQDKVKSFFEGKYKQYYIFVWLLYTNDLFQRMKRLCYASVIALYCLVLAWIIVIYKTLYT